MESADLTWRKASYSSNGGANCIEVAHDASRVLVRDTKDRTGPVLRFSPAAWRQFADQLKGGSRSLGRGPGPNAEGPLWSLKRPGWPFAFLMAIWASDDNHQPFVRRAPQLLGAFLTHLCGGHCRAGEAGKGVWGKTWNRAARGARGFRFSPSAFPDWSPLLPVYSRSRAVVFLTSPSCSMRG